MVTAVPEIQVEQLRPDHDFLIIACDGIWDCLTSQQAVDFVYEHKTKLLKKSTTMSQSLKVGKTTGAGAAARKGAASPAKKQTTISHQSSSALQLSKQASGASPATKLAATSSHGTEGGQVQISKIVEQMMDKICPMNIAASEGLGADNMTCVVIEFSKQTGGSSAASTASTSHD